MSDQPYATPLRFSDYHGCNIFIGDNGLLSNGQYLNAHGQFITQAPLKHDETFGLEFRGTGIVKFNTFQYKRQAIDWIMSRQPLQKGCKRIKLKGIARYRVKVSNKENCITIISIQRPEKEAFTFVKGPEATLAFDIECGDVAVFILNKTSSVTFDSCYLSPNVELATSQPISTASLRHYNPSALCSLESIPLFPGTIFILEVRHSGQRNDSGSYLRTCVYKLRNLYVNDKIIQCCGTSTCPAYKGRKVHLAKGATEILRVRVMPDGLAIDRKYKKGIDRLICPTTGENTLWFELHKVSLRVWHLLDYNSTKPQPDITKIELNSSTPEQDTTKIELNPAASALTEPTSPTICRRLPSKCARNGPSELSGPVDGVTNDMYFPQTSSVIRGKNVHSFRSGHSSYVLADSWGESVCLDNAAIPNHSSSINPISTRIAEQCDLLRDLYVDSTSPPSIGPDLITLSSLESQSDSRVRSQKNSDMEPRDRDTVYEKPDLLWFKDKAKPCMLSSFLNVNNIKRPQLASKNKALHFVPELQPIKQLQHP